MPASVKVVPASDGKASSSSSGDDLSSAIGRPASRTKVCGWSGSMDSAAQVVLHTPSKLDTRIVFVKVFIFSPQLKITPLPTFEVAGGRTRVRWQRVSARLSHRKFSARTRNCQRHRPCELQTSVGDLTIDCGHTDKIGMAVSMARKNVSVRCCPTHQSGRCSANMWRSSAVCVNA